MTPERGVPGPLDLCPAVAGCGGSEFPRAHSPLAPPRTARAAAAAPLRAGEGSPLLRPDPPPCQPDPSLEVTTLPEAGRGHGSGSRHSSGSLILGSSTRAPLFPHQ